MAGSTRCSRRCGWFSTSWCASMRINSGRAVTAISAEPRRSWSKDSLHELLEGRFRDLKFIAVSNREPYIHRFRNGRVECIQPASGLTVALDPILRATGGTWVAHGSGDADRLTVDARAHV